MSARKKVLILKTVAADGTSHGSFKWPLNRGAKVKPAKWSPDRECGNGLHGFLWGEGNGELASWDKDAKWIVFEADADKVVDLGGKVKVPAGVVRFVGDQKGATEFIAKHGPGGKAIVGGTATAGYGGTATAGDGGTATAGYGGTATAGPDGQMLIQWFDGNRYRTAIGVVGENGIKPNTKYRVTENGSLEEVK